MSLAERPRHGRLVLETGSSSGSAADDGGSGIMEVEMRDISVADLRTAGVRLVYQHDGSETAQDSFELTLSNGNQVTCHQFVGCTIWLLTK